MQQTVTPGNTVQQLKRIALNFSAKPIFIPCYAKRENGRKPPCKMGFPSKTPLKEKAQMPTNLDSFSAMEILSVYLGDELIVLDIDGKEAMNFYEVLVKNLGKPPETLYVTSDPVENTRGAYFFRIPENYKTKIQHHSQKIGDRGDKLEFRTGDHYQAISGLHPVSGYYYSPNLGDYNYGNIPELSKDWCDYITNLKIVSAETKKENQDAIVGNKLVSLRDLLDLLDGLEDSNVSYEDYETWIRIGMIYHAIDDSDIGLEAWIDWSSQAENPATEQVFREKWKSFNADSYKAAGIGSVFYWLDQKVRGTSISEDRKSEITQKIADARRYITPKAWAEDVLIFVKSLKEEGIYGEVLNNAIENFTLEAYGNLNEFNLTHVWNKYHSLDGGITEGEKEAYTQSLIDSVLSTPDVSEIYEIMGDCSIIEIIQSYFRDQGLDIHYPIGLMSFFTCVASILPKGISMNFNQDYCRPPIIYSIILGEPSDGKNAVMDVFRRPLEDAHLKQANAWNKAIQEWNKEQSKFKGLNKKEKENYIQVQKLQAKLALSQDVPVCFEDIHPEPARPRVYTYAKFTIEDIRKAAGEQKDFGFLVCPSEIKNTISAQAKYSSDKSGMPDMSEYTVAWDGDSTQSGVLSDPNRPSDRYQFSLLTTIQPEVFDRTFSNQDPDGFLSRTFFLSIDVPIDHKLNEDPDNPDVQNIGPLLWAFYQDLILKFQGVSWDNRMPMKFTYEAKQVYNKFIVWCNDQAKLLDGASKGFRPFLRRMPAKIASLLIVMNAIKFQEGLIDDPNRVDLKTTLEAIKFARLVITYAQRIYKINLGVDYDLIDSKKLEVYQRVINLMIRRKGEIELRTLCVQQWRYNPDYIIIFNKSKKFKKAMQKEDMLNVVEEMVALGWITYDPKSTIIKLVSEKLSDAKTKLEIPINLEVKV